MFDLMASPGARQVFTDDIESCGNVQYTLVVSDCVTLAVEREEFRDESLYVGKYVTDGRRERESEKARRVCQHY